MAPLRQRLVKIFTNRRVLATIIIVIGVGLIFVFGARSIRSYRHLQYIREQGLDRGQAEVSAIQPWMTIRYVSVAYGVPEEYIFARLDIPFDRRSSNDYLGRLNQVFQLGRSAQGDYPAIIDAVAEAILAYRADPVATGLADIRPWMTLRYIANSTGVPESYLLDQLGLSPANDTVFKPLDRLADEVHYEQGLRGLIEATKAALSRYEVSP
jgi:hypothetical protein